ncbi:class A beta-lactamase-related serine hydrolase [Pseudarthrobacter sp. RMG13]|uniref:Class A beta-lactamase-related serine hydrolase n=1 Tax=Pseudarthrobacter humi TaxID=2952523 RepID=A0ABT1LR45_9MICC|nr:serine hydrolase [Pseudarthrobacter humi]MCP8999651.1 class A beta-lactamase-related serine hydrolase [Pseudarthrobacter humi]
MDAYSPAYPAGRHYHGAGRSPLSLVLSVAAALMVLLAAVTSAVVRSERVTGTVSAAFAGTGPVGAMAAVGAGTQVGAMAAVGAGTEDGSIARTISRVSGFRVGVAVADTAGGPVRTFGDTAAYTAASTAKLITAAAYLRLVEAGEARLDETLGKYTAAFQLKSMINSSNNDSWLLLMGRIGYQRLIQYAASIGIAYDPSDNRLSPGEVAQVLTKLYAGQLLNPSDTAQLLMYMQETNNEELIPAASGPGITVYHKYGQLGGNLHDAALLEHGGTTYALVIFTEGADSTDEAERTQMIHELTQAFVMKLFPSRQATCC